MWICLWKRHQAGTVGTRRADHTAYLSFFPSQERHLPSCLSPCHHPGAVLPAPALGKGASDLPSLQSHFLQQFMTKPPGERRSPALRQSAAWAGLAPGSTARLSLPPSLHRGPAVHPLLPGRTFHGCCREVPRGADTQRPLGTRRKVIIPAASPRELRVGDTCPGPCPLLAGTDRRQRALCGGCSRFPWGPKSCTPAGSGGPRAVRNSPRNGRERKGRANGRCFSHGGGPDPLLKARGAVHPSPAAGRH